MKSIIYMIIAVFLMVGVAVAGDETFSPEEWKSIEPIMEDIYKICGENEKCLEEQIASAMAISGGLEEVQRLPEDQAKYMILGVFDLCAILTMDDEFSMNFSEMRICVDQSLDRLDKELDELALQIKKQSGI